MNKNKSTESMSDHNKIVEGAELNGNLQSPGDIRVDGKVKGNLTVGGKLVVGPTGYVEGNIVAKEVSISGQVVGQLNVKGLSSLHKTARIQAELTTEKLAIEPGAQFTGTCQMGSSKAMNQSQPQDQQARTGTQTSASVS
ncbi:MAG: polymer-forming cytoskeletal protein [Flavobacteriales bacterium]|jgi:cytoskeletal protein CcmA (bactofilin family)|nr:polymer-forming cytoskeletal protein [Flavobacteriales bacterium]NCF57510.1 polymer-forming cytoskeletal protein [Bacteroidota bacterium]NCG43680.1 polymer-forming cytoskeletal protein [Pseudomonadota bacterium]MBT3572140.1 polymer-forming cytoskeletal protein [Flavobacteriales bacterium]MBT3677897.1 polymer-forming cytoskeletal protein [Flavobacteriales bacterium]